MTDIDGALAALRLHGQTPSSLGELAELADRLLAAADSAPDRPTTERTVRFYVSRGVVRPPKGRGASARWEYPHLIDLLAARLAQHDGVALDEVARRRAAESDAGLERLVAERLRVIADPSPAPTEVPAAPSNSDWRRFPIGAGAELHLGTGHPLMQDQRRLKAVLGEVARIMEIPDPES